MKSHPNAVIGGGSAVAVAATLYLLSLVGVELPDPPLEVGIFLGGVVASVVLFIGREGLRGLVRRIWRGRT